MNKVLCVQISTNLINGKPDLTDISQQYYNKLYKVKTNDGYIKHMVKILNEQEPFETNQEYDIRLKKEPLYLYVKECVM